MQSNDISGCPWRDGKSYGSQPIITLHKEIEHFFEYISVTPEEHCMRLSILERVIDVIHAEWPKANVETFGSFQTGLYLPTGDMDLVVIGEWGTLPLHSLAQALLKNGVCNENIQVLDRASVPIVKMTDKSTGIKLDISFNANNGVRSAEMIKHYMNVFPMLPKLMLVLKQVIAQRNMNEVFHGGISSYSLILMVVSFLQLHPRGVLDCNIVNLGVLLIEFLEHYGKKFDYKRTAIRVKDGGQLVPKYEVRKHSVGGYKLGGILCIEDPLMPGNDIGRGSYGAFWVKRVFEYAFTALTNALVDPQVVSSGDSVLGRIVRVKDDVIQYRHWARVTYAVQNAQRIIPIRYLATDDTVSSGSAESDSDSSAEKSSDRGDQTNDRHNDQQPFRRECSRYRIRNTWNRPHQTTINPSGDHTSASARRIQWTSPRNSYHNRDVTNKNYNGNHNHWQNYRQNYWQNCWQNYRQNYWQNAGNKRRYTNNAQPDFGIFKLSYEQRKRKKQTHDAR